MQQQQQKYINGTFYRKYGYFLFVVFKYYISIYEFYIKLYI